jgi:hypothetical protein
MIRDVPDFDSLVAVVIDIHNLDVDGTQRFDE